jgi:hypothetical protein
MRRRLGIYAKILDLRDQLRRAGEARGGRRLEMLVLRGILDELERRWQQGHVEIDERAYRGVVEWQNRLAAERQSAASGVTT